MIDTMLFRARTFKLAFEDASDTGYIVECGVGTGKTTKMLTNFASVNHKIFGFDSFEGLPEDWKMNDYFTWPAGSFAEEEIPEIPGVDIRVGYFADTLPIWKKEHTGRIALLHIDSDLYSSAITVLEELNDQIVPGTVIVSDDHFEKLKYKNWEQGQYKAFNEWLVKYDRKSHLLSRGILGQAAFRILQ
jgi:hypothetical protein